MLACYTYINTVESLLCSYFNVVRKNVKDLVPKSIIFFLVNSSKENIQNELVSALYKEELFEELVCTLVTAVQKD